MISDEVRMLINRMRSNPEEFAVAQLNFGADRELRVARRWDNFMHSLVNRKPDIELIFNQEELEALRQTASEILRPLALGTIVTHIVGGEEKEQAEFAFEPEELAQSPRYIASAVDIQVAKKLKMELGNYLKMKAGCGL